jgi:predicted PurR-regulated permease PerM
MLHYIYMPGTSVERTFFFVILGIMVIVILAIFWPFLSVLVLAAAFAVVLHPVYEWIHKHVTKKISWISSLITVVLFIGIVCTPVLYVATAAFGQIQTAYGSIVAMTDKSKVFESVSTSINKALPEGFSVDVGAKVSDLVGIISHNVTGFFTSTFQAIILFMLMLMTIFYFLKDGPRWKVIFTRICPLSEKHINEIFDKLKVAINQIIKGAFFIALLQGVFTGIGFHIFGVPNATLWAVAAGIASFIPTIGTSMVAVPAILFLFSTGMNGNAIGLLAWSVCLVGLIDNLLAPYIISKDSEIPSLFILFSILGGVSLLGPTGILIGPLALSLLFALISIYRKEANI